jgi:hypothetical protein
MDDVGATYWGAFLDLSPEFVYLHCGTRDGARALGLLRCLSADDLESFLCTFKDRFKATGRQQ